MANLCDFCGDSTPTVYCKSDMARLCLSCDRYVHGANALSRKHLRSLLCDKCNLQQATVRCQTESLSLCQDCDWNIHGNSPVASQHKRPAIVGYTGCPSAAELSRIWGLDEFPPTNVTENATGFTQEFDGCMKFSASASTAKTVDDTVDRPGCSDKAFGIAEQQSKQKPVVVQQLHDLQNLTPQSSKQFQKHTPMQIQNQSQVQVESKSMGPPPSKSLVEELQAQNQYQQRQESNQHQEQHQLRLHNHQEQEISTVPLFMSDTQQLKPDSNIEQIIEGEAYWRCSPASNSNQLWDPHMQDLGLCEGGDSFDGFNMSDVDLTFENYEDMFASSQEQSDSLFEDAGATCSNIERDVSFVESNGHIESAPEILRTVESEGVQGLTEVERRKYVPPVGAGFIGNSFSIFRRPLHLPNPFFQFGPGSYLFAQARMVEDYIMSQTVTQAMMDGGLLGLVVVVTGASHVLLGTRGSGLPARISKKIPKKTQAVVLLNPERQHIRNEGDIPVADFLWYSAAIPCTRNCFDRAEIARIMDAAGRTQDALPQDLQKGLELGLVSPEVLQNFFDLEKQPLIAELTHHFQGLRERWLADPRFLQRLALEEIICIATTLIAQYQKRKERFMEELDYVLSDSLRSAVVSFFAVWLPAPTLSFLSYEENISNGTIDGLKGLLGLLPDNAFQRNGVGQNWDLRARITTVLMGGLKLFCVGFVSSIGTVSVTNVLFTIRQQWREDVARHENIPKFPVFKTALVYGSFLGTSANLRYQFVSGIVEHWGADYLLASKPYLGNLMSFLARVINSYVGTRQWIDLARLTGVQQSKDEPENFALKMLDFPAAEQLESEKSFPADPAIVEHHEFGKSSMHKEKC